MSSPDVWDEMVVEKVVARLGVLDRAFTSFRHGLGPDIKPVEAAVLLDHLDFLTAGGCLPINATLKWRIKNSKYCENLGQSMQIPYKERNIVFYSISNFQPPFFDFAKQVLLVLISLPPSTE